MVACPCCGLETLNERERSETCSDCAWLDDGQPVEWHAAEVLTPWQLLHDGVVSEIVRRGSRVTLTVTSVAARKRLSVPGDAIQLELAGCTQLEYAAYEGQPTSTIATIRSAKHLIVDAERAGDEIVVWGSAGSLRVKYRAVALRLDSRTFLEVATLRRAVDEFWTDWRTKQPPRRS